MKKIFIFICLLICSSPLICQIEMPIKQDAPILIVMGTRPEAIKLLPLYNTLVQNQIPTFLCSTGQHTHLTKDLFTFFSATPDIELNIMKEKQDLFYTTSIVLEKMKEIYQQVKPRLVVVQGDTTTAMAAALAAFYARIPVAHIEAGLRSGSLQAPYPEELNRRLITLLSSLHFAPTPLNVENLLAENVAAEQIFCTGNTGIDALYMIRNKLITGEIQPNPELAALIKNQRQQGKEIILLTAHRRESFGIGLETIFAAVKEALEIHPSLFIIYPMHPNPAIQQAIDKVGLKNSSNLYLTHPLPYQDLVYLLETIDGVATDSGGIQEESMSLNQPTIVLRNESDRPEGLIEGRAMLVGLDKQRILEGFDWLLKTKKSMGSHDQQDLFGKGQACQMIMAIINNSDDVVSK